MSRTEGRLDMAVFARPAVRRVGQAQRVAFGVTASLVGPGAGVGSGGLVALVQAWFLSGADAAHRVHEAGWGGFMGILIAVGLLLQAWRSERKVALYQQVVAAVPAMLAAVALTDAVDPLPLMFVAAFVVLAVLHPARHQLFRWPSGGSPVLAGLAVAGAVPLTSYALGQVGLERTAVAGDPHAGHWSGMAALALAVPLVALVAAGKAPGWRATAWCAGLAAAVLGLSFILFPGLPSSLGVAWGALAVVGGAVVIAVAEVESRRTTMDACPRADRQ